MRAVRPDREGRFSVAGLPPASYRVAVAGRLEEGAWSDQQLLADLEASALLVTLTEGQTRTVHLR